MTEGGVASVIVGHACLPGAGRPRARERYLTEFQTIDGGEALPGFTLEVRRLFEGLAK
jgi:hypothetical protein